MQLIQSSSVNLCTSSYSLTEENITALLCSLEAKITRAAWSLYYRLYAVNVTIEDLVQEGMIAAWQAAMNLNPAKVKDPGSLPGYCLIRARGAMYDYVRKQFRTPADSLNEWEEMDPDQGGRRELSARPEHQPLENEPASRAAIMAALDFLTEKERAAVMASFAFEDEETGLVTGPEEVQVQLNMSKAAYADTKRRALKRLAIILQA